MKALVSMKIRQADRDKLMEPKSMATDGPDYPWGLSITLDDDSLEKLGLDLPEVGTMMTLVANVKVTNVSESASPTYKQRSLGLQITEMALEDGKKGESVAKRLYGED